MKIKSIRYGTATVCLSAEDCRLLAEACEAATGGILGRERAGDVAHMETLGAALRGLIVSCYAQWGMRMEDLRALEGLLGEMGIGF